MEVAANHWPSTNRTKTAYWARPLTMVHEIRHKKNPAGGWWRKRSDPKIERDKHPKAIQRTPKPRPCCPNRPRTKTAASREQECCLPQTQTGPAQDRKAGAKLRKKQAPSTRRQERWPGPAPGGPTGRMPRLCPDEPPGSGCSRLPWVRHAPRHGDAAKPSGARGARREHGSRGNRCQSKRPCRQGQAERGRLCPGKQRRSPR
mmetsp:Transcript_10407/g.63539  ORF Transcript_10407/g.63539 Transcript_10407/m.63539 type:complete len:203 (+) Transcript_10407:11373-11981(+)